MSQRIHFFHYEMHGEIKLNYCRNHTNHTSTIFQQQAEFADLYLAVHVACTKLYGICGHGFSHLDTRIYRDTESCHGDILF